jgi:serine/threonine protein kinase
MVQVGEQLGNYKLIKQVGTGGYAWVYQAEQVHLNTQVAIKILINTQLTGNDVDKFRTEARTIASLKHPNIVRLIDYGMEGDTPYLVMDYAPNGTLRQRHPEGTALPPQAILDYVKQVAAALQYVHNQKMIHRDVKPQNMLIGHNNEILLTDFGIATVAPPTQNIQQSVRSVVGTIDYMAPEQLEGRPTVASDQYSLAIVVYEWLRYAPIHRCDGNGHDAASKHSSSAPA